jgi:hypothetical protein
MGEVAGQRRPATLGPGGIRKREPPLPRPGAGRGLDHLCVPSPQWPASDPARSSTCHGRVGRLPWSLGPRPVPNPAKAGILEPSRFDRAGSGNATRVSLARAQRCPIHRRVLPQQRPAPDPAGAERPAQGRGGRWPWPWGPRLGPGPIRRGGAEASASAMEGGVGTPRYSAASRRDQETHTSPPRRRPGPRCVHSHPRPAPDPAGKERPPRAGRDAGSGPSGARWQSHQPLSR